MTKKLEIRLVEDGQTQPKVRMELPLAAAAVIKTMIPSSALEKMAKDNVDLDSLLSNLEQKQPQVLLEYRSGNKTATLSIIEPA